MSYKEAPVLRDMEKRLKFPVLEWLDLESFKSKLESFQQIYPHIDSVNNQKYYIGKSIANDEYFDRVGCVQRDNEGGWELKIINHGNKLFSCNCKQDFVILTLNDPNSYYWKNSERNTAIPKHALCFYNSLYNIFCTLATTICDGTVKQFIGGFRYFRRIHNQNKRVVPNVGEVDENGVLSVSRGEIIETYAKYSVLCLKPSPASLKSLCRSVIRVCTGHNNANISALNQHIQEVLVGYLKYPSHLYKGECMINGDRIVSEDGKYELEICNNILRFNSLLPTKEEECSFDDDHVASIHLLAGRIVTSLCESPKLVELWTISTEKRDDKRVFYRSDLVLSPHSSRIKIPFSNIEVYSRDKKQFEKKGEVDYYGTLCYYHFGLDEPRNYYDNLHVYHGYYDDDYPYE